MSEARAAGRERNAREAVREIARSHELDRYLAALLAPQTAREDLIVIAAFAGELARIPHTVREPMMGEIRLQWWRDAIDGFTSGAATGHPVADGVAELVRRRRLPPAQLLAAVNAREADLYADPVADEAALLNYLSGTEGSIFALAAGVIGQAPEPDAQLRVRHAGAAFGMTRLLVGLPRGLARGRVPLPTTWLAEAGLPPDAPWTGQPSEWHSVLARAVGFAHDHLDAARRLLPRSLRKDSTPFLPLALVEPYLQAFEKRKHDPPREIADIAPLRRVWRLWRAHRSGRI